RPFPYGQTHDRTACNTGQPEGGPVALGTTAPVGSFTRCEGGFDGIFDMVGNVTEWENACDGVTSAGAGQCVTRGGSYRIVYDPCISASPATITSASLDWGIRCCASVVR